MSPLNAIFAFLIVAGIVVSVVSGNVETVTDSAISGARDGVEKVIAFVGVMTLWLGMARIAEESGLMASMTRLIHPLLRPLFPSVPDGHPAMGAMLMNMVANMMGFGSAATPFGLKAMEHLQELNARRDTASDAMCTFLAINTASVTLVPATVIAFRAAAGSANPSEIIGPAIVATACSSVVALTADRIFRGRGRS